MGYTFCRLLKIFEVFEYLLNFFKTSFKLDLNLIWTWLGLELVLNIFWALCELILNFIWTFRDPNPVLTTVSKLPANWPVSLTPASLPKKPSKRNWKMLQPQKQKQRRSLRRSLMESWGLFNCWYILSLFVCLIWS